MTALARSKAWAVRNQDLLILAGIGTVVVGLVVVGVKADIAARARMTAELDAYVDQLNGMADLIGL